MTGIEMLRDVCMALKGSPWCGTDVVTIGGEPACEKLSKIADQIERETLPRPRFEDGEPVQFGDEFVDSIRGNVGEVRLIKFYHNNRWEVWGDSAAVDWRSGSLKRPEPPKVLDADGVEIKVGDEVWEIEDGIDPFTVVEINGERVIGKLSSVLLVDIHCSKLTHKRPELPDTWEKIEADSKKFVCDYYGRKLMFDCREGKSDACPVSGTDDECEVRMAQDLVRRCKALAEVE